MNRPRNCASATIIALLTAAVGPALGAIGCANTGGLGDSSASACECDGLPAPDGRVPWARTWRDIRYSPDGQAVALVGITPFFVNAMRARNSGSAGPRDGTPESDALIQGGVHVLAWRPDGTTSHFVAPYELYEDEVGGAWSADSRYYAKVIWEDKSSHQLVLCDLDDGSWTRAASIDRWTTSPPSWNPVAPEVAVVESWTSASGGYRAAAQHAPPCWSPDGRRIALVRGGVTIVGISADGRFEAPLVLESPAPIVQMAWCPSGKGLLLFCKRKAPDVIEFLSIIPRMGENVPHRRIYSVWFLDPSTGEATECEGLRVTNRDVDWKDAWMIPRAAEAFARWTR